MAKTKTKRLRQQMIPGTEPPSIPKIDKAAEAYVEVRDERMSLTEKETDAHDNLLSLLREHGLETYEFDGMTVRIDTKQKVKVRRKNEEAQEDEGDE
jgi:hypothetical protein